MIKRTLLAGSVAAMALAGASNAATFDLAFIMDESGSVGSTNYTNAMDSLADALEGSLTAAVLAQDSYKISVISFSDTNGNRSGGAATDIDVSAVLVNDLTTLAGVTADIRAATYSGGNTNYAAAFNALDSLSGALTTGSSGSIINMMTDGEPCPAGNCPIGSTTSTLADILTARNALKDDWDALSFEAVTSGPDTAYLAGLAFDLGGDGAVVLNDEGDINDPLNEAFVLRVTNFGDDYDAAIAAKVAKIVDPDPVNPVPVPAALPLLLAGMGTLGFMARRRNKAA